MTPSPPPRTSGGAVKVRFLIIGAWNTIFGILAFAAADVTVGRVAGYVASVTAMFAVAVPQAHLAQRLWVWRSHAPYLPELLRFSWVFLLAYVVNLAALASAVELLHAPTLPAQVVISFLIAVCTYLVHRTWTFGHAHVAPEPRPSESVGVRSGRAQDAG